MLGIEQVCLGPEIGWGRITEDQRAGRLSHGVVRGDAEPVGRHAIHPQDLPLEVQTKDRLVDRIEGPFPFGSGLLQHAQAMSLPLHQLTKGLCENACLVPCTDGVQQREHSRGERPAAQFLHDGPGCL
jgi:hypothetical protein